MAPRFRPYYESARDRTTRSARYIRSHKKRFIFLFWVIAHTAGALTSIEAIMTPRSAQGAVAWAVSLNTIPYLAVPIYWLVGNTSFDGYETKRHQTRSETSPTVTKAIDQAREAGFIVNGDAYRLQNRIANLPATTGNEVTLLRNGEQYFSSIFDGIDAAEHYVLIEFFIVKDDSVGRSLQQHLIAAARRGVKVYFIYDALGSFGLPNSYVEPLREAGAQVRSFNDMTGLAKRFQINFRNHRKLVVVDGRHAWAGGANIADEYMGTDEDLTAWFDTMIKVTGPAATFTQVPFLEDWFWTSGELLDLDWTSQAADSGAAVTVLSLPTGPADDYESCALYFLDAINSATRRVWIASPYFVPDQQIISALQMAAMRGVDVRILIPDESDSTLASWSAWSYIGELELLDIKVHRYTGGFLHYKALLVDETRSAISSANFDNRSFRLNFEITMEVHDEAFAREVEAMFLEDFANSRLATAEEVAAWPFYRRLAVRVARLLAPLQ